MKEAFQKDRESYLYMNSKMTLSDKLGRPYEIDIGGLIRDVVEKGKGDKKSLHSYHGVFDFQIDDSSQQKKNKKTDISTSNALFGKSHLNRLQRRPFYRNC